MLFKIPEVSVQMDVVGPGFGHNGADPGDT
jgi:hypothetical protein